ncbi:MAG: copper chaperone PCu(A)C [Salinibacter sp.]
MLRFLHARSLIGILSAAALLLTAAGCQSQSSQDQETGPPPLPDNEIAIEDPWVRPAPAGSTTTLSMTIANGRQGPDTLLEARAPIVDSSAVRRASADGSGTMGFLPIPARTRTTLAPDTAHIRLLSLGQSLDENSTLILNLEFAQSGLQRVQVPVQRSAPTD